METPSFKIVTGFALAALGLLYLTVTGVSELTAGYSLDNVLTQQGLKDVLAQYSASDIAVHRRLTSQANMVFPFVYGAFSYFAAKRYAAKPWVYIIIFWTIIGMIFDFAENVSILNLLKGEDAFALKTVFTRAKIVFLAVPIALCAAWYLSEIFKPRKALNR